MSGPMSRRPRFNIPAFQQEAARIEALYGCQVVCPHDLDPDEVTLACLESPDGRLEDIASGMNWEDFILRDLDYIAQEIDGIALMPDWFASRGARVEVAFAIELGLPFLWKDKLYTAEEMRHASKNSPVG